MTEAEQKIMWAIDQKVQLGDKITDEEKEFFNANYEKMREEMKENYEHWKFHAWLIK